jgi:hypothetical protein
MTDYNPDDLAWLHNIDAIRLVETCWSHPEQYEAFLDARQVGYLRLRYGHVTLGGLFPPPRQPHQGTSNDDESYPSPLPCPCPCWHHLSRLTS